MEYNQPTASIFNEPSAPQKLPSFLNVLTILTIIGSILAILSGISEPILNKKLKSQNDASLEKVEQMNAKDSTKSNIENNLVGFTKNSANIAKVELDNEKTFVPTKVIAAIFCLIGAFLMRKQKKVGFFLYLIGEWAFAFYYCYTINGMPGSALFIALKLFFPILFTILYAINLKHLKK